MKKIQVGILGYGNLGRGALQALGQTADMACAAVFSRRAGALSDGHEAIAVHHPDTLPEWVGRLDVLLLCGGSARDIPAQGPAAAALFNTVDSYDAHRDIPAHLAAMEKAALGGGHIALLSMGWDPGLFSLARCLFAAALPRGNTHTFWGRGVSQGHSQAIRGLPGVADARQYTVPIPGAVAAARAGGPARPATETHRRQCFVVAKPGADKGEIERAIRQMPQYFAGYETTVDFVSQGELAAAHSRLPHAGTVLQAGKTADGAAQTMELSLALGSNPAFTAELMVAGARAVARLSRRGETGARTILDIPPALFSPLSREELVALL